MSREPPAISIDNQGSGDLLMELSGELFTGSTCCSKCYIVAQNVDVYYWPEPDATTACLRIVGNDTNPPLSGATKYLHGAYWGCTARDSMFVTTARLANIGPVTFKQSLFNPWSSLPCTSTPSNAVVPSSYLVRDHGSIDARGHSIVIPKIVTQSNNVPINTFLSRSFTVYVRSPIKASFC